MKTFLFTFEGPEGAGKTTQIKLLSKWMKERSIQHVVTKEPGTPNIPECLKLRNLILDPQNDLVPTSELFLFLADRAQHVEKLIKPSLNKGIHVICDRFSDSTRVYQSARGLSRQKIDMMIYFATGGLIPDLTFILDIPAHLGLKRTTKDEFVNGDRMENAGLKFHQDVRQGFLKLKENLNEGDRFFIVNCAPPKNIKSIHNEIIEEVSRKLWIP